MENKYIYSLFVGLVLFFQLALFSYFNWLLVEGGALNGVLDKYLLLKTPLSIIPSIFLLYFFYGGLVYLREK